jgi:Flp pilus assembly protein TadG
MTKTRRSDRSSEDLVRRHGVTCGTPRRLGGESGQAATEFALILLPLLIVVGGIIYFGIGLNYWLDMNRIANQGARQAVVNHWPPQCPRGETSCATSTSTTACATVMAANSKADLQDVLRCQTRNNAAVTVCYPGKTPGGSTTDDPVIGDPVQVRMTAPFTFFFINKARITLTAKATMRLEQTPTLITNAGGPICP